MKSNKMIKAQGLAAFKSQYWLSVLTYVIAAAAISVLSGSFNIEFKTDMPKAETINVIMPFAAAAVSVFSLVALAAKIALVPISYGYKKVLLQEVDGKKIQIKDMFSLYKKFGKVLGLEIVIYLKILAWTLLFIVPGIVAAYRYSLAGYIFAENPEMGIMEAINESRRLMKGFKGKLFGLDMSFIGWTLLSALTLGVLFVFYVGPYYYASCAVFYRERVLTDKSGNLG